jgi:hypothetical protein
MMFICHHLVVPLLVFMKNHNLMSKCLIFFIHMVLSLLIRYHHQVVLLLKSLLTRYHHQEVLVLMMILSLT